MVNEQHIKEILEEDITDLIKKLINRKENQYNGIYAGEIVSNKDPDKLGRCRVQVYGIYDDIQDNDLPWAIPEFNFLGSKVGSFTVPPIGTKVNVRFSNGNIYEPIYTSRLLNENDLPSEKDENYPNNLIFFKTDNGDIFSINLITKETTYLTSQGVKFYVDRQGNIEIDTTAVKIPMQGAITINANGPVTINAPIVKIPHNVSGVVTPDPTGGPFNSLIFDPITGAPHQGTMVTNT